jgi:hypothetical protein
MSLSAGTWTFGTNSDDGAQLTVGGVTVLDDNQPNSPTDTLGTYTFNSSGEYRLDLLYFQQNGGASVELYAAPGNWNSFSSAVPFQLVGDTADGGLCVTNIGSPSGYTVAGVAGHNLYLVNSSPGIAPGNYTDVTVASANFTAEIAASAGLTLNVSGAGNAISGAIGGAVAEFNASTNNGNITIQYVNPNAYAPFQLGSVNAGNAQIQLVAQGSPDGSRAVLHASGGPRTPLIPAGLGQPATTVWDTATGKLLFRLEGDGGALHMLMAFSPDGKRLATADLRPGVKTAIKVWDAATGRELLSLKSDAMGGQQLPNLSFSPDGHRLLLQRPNGEGPSWDATPRPE